MDHQPGRLVDHDDVLVLEHDVQVNLFRRVGLVFGRTLWHDDDRLVAIRGILAARWLAVDQHMAAVEPELDAAAGKLRHQAGDDLVETVAASVRRQFQGNGRQVDADLGRQQFCVEFVIKIRVYR